MLNERLAVAKCIAAAIHDAEAQIDAAVCGSAALAIAIVDARSELKLPASMAQETLNSLIASMKGLIDSRRDMIEAHAGLDVVREQIGLGSIRSWGDQWPKPPAPKAEGEVQPLRAVS